MVGSNITFLAMILLGYGGMPRRYATYLPQFATLHQVATLGAILLLIGQIIWLYNMVSSWFEGKRVESGDPWNLRQDNVRTIEWQWFEQKRDTQIATDGGDETVATDGGEPADESDA
jgi:cytochrome c oxidase subunit 1